MAEPNAAKWQEAVDVEMAATKKHRVWKVMDLPLGKHAIGSRIIVDKKRAEQVDGVQKPEETRRYKARCYTFMKLDLNNISIHRSY